MGNFSLNCCTSDIFSTGTPETKEIIKAKEVNLGKDNNATMGMSSSYMFRGRTTESSRPTNQFIIDDQEVAVNILLSANYYNLLTQQNEDEDRLKPLENFSSKTLILIIYQIYNISSSLIVTVQTKKIFELYDQVLTPIFNRESNTDDESNENSELLKVISDITEIYHYFKYWLSGQKGAYIVDYWENIPNKDEYFTEKIRNIQNYMRRIQIDTD